MRSIPLLSALLLFCVLSAPVSAATLLLAHFDKYSLDADYAASGLVAATVTAGARGGQLGYFPGPNSGAADVGYNTQPTSILTLPARGNLDTRQGTIEFFLKTKWDWTAAGVEGMGNPDFLYVPLEPAGHLMVYAYHHTPSGMVTLAFNLHDGKTDHPINANVTAIGKREVDQPWAGDEWHYIAVSWTPNWSRLFADGKQVAMRTWVPPLSMPPVRDQMWVGCREKGSTRVLIDELRIQDTAAEQVTVPTEPYPIPTAADTTPAAEGGPWATIPCYRVAAPPTLDGRVADPVWKRVPWVGGFKKLATGGIFTAVPTRFALAYDDQALYLAAVCSEPNLAGLKAKNTARDSATFSDDALELFLDPLRCTNPYYQMVFNTVGGQYDGKGFDASWNGEWKTWVAKGDHQWSAELVLPFTTVGMTPQEGQVWGFNLARDRYAGGGGDLSSWSPITGFHDPRAFGGVKFEGAPPVPAATMEAALNAAYVKETQDLIKSNAALWERQTQRLSRQLTSREVPADLRAQLKSATEAVAALRRADASLPALDAARLTMLALSADLDRLVAQMQQNVPVGPVRPPAELKPGLNRKGDLWYFVGETVVFAVDGKRGIVGGMWDRQSGRRLVAASADHYWAETVASTTEAEELDDTVTKSAEKSGRLTLTCANPDLPGVTLVKEYWLRPEGTMLARRVTVTGRPAEKTLFRASSRTYFDEDFRRRAYYQRLMHPAITADSIKQAADITQKIPEPGFMGQSVDGCAQMCASNLQAGLGVGQFLLKVNDRYVYPPRNLQMSYSTPWGWEMSWLAGFLKPQPFSAETVYMLYPGDHFNFHQRYLELPEWKELIASWQIQPWVKKTRMVTMGYIGWGNMPPPGGALNPYTERLARIPAVLQRPDEKMLYLQQQPGDNWGEWPAADGEMCRYREPNTDKFKSQIPAEKVRLGIQRLHEMDLPHYRFGFYQFPIDVSPGTPPVEKGWYVVTKEGKPARGWYDPAFNTYITDCSPAFIDYTVQAVARQLDYYKTDFIYFDYPYPSLYADWKGEGRVVHTYDWMDFYRRLHEECAKRGAAFFFNSGAGVPFADAGIFEGIPGRGTYMNAGYMTRWQNLFSDPMLMMKLYEKPGFASHVWAWAYIWSNPDMDNGREITNYSLLFGMRPSAATNSEWGEQLKAFTPPGGEPDWLANARSIDAWQRACFELAPSRMVDVGLSPCWWREETQIEAYALQMGPAHVLTCLNHYPEDRAVTLTARRDRLGLQPGKRTFVWNFNARPLSSIVRQPDPPPANWDRLCLEISCHSAIQDQAERVSVDLGNLPPQLVRLAAVTQVPGFLVSAHGQDTQFLLPHNLDCTVDGTADETAKTVRLTVKADKPVEILAWWPPAWGNAQAEITGAAAQAPGPVPAERMVTYDAERFARLALPAGESTVTLTVAG